MAVFTKLRPRVKAHRLNGTFDTVTRLAGNALSFCNLFWSLVFMQKILLIQDLLISLFQFSVGFQQFSHCVVPIQACIRNRPNILPTATAKGLSARREQDLNCFQSSVFSSPLEGRSPPEYGTRSVWIRFQFQEPAQYHRIPFHSSYLESRGTKIPARFVVDIGTEVEKPFHYLPVAATNGRL
ncbi:hypothetical protein CKAH01_07223 [Colletotrichum kahawae]|uniref:Uncharacterized protein n=1 Tax=Colletotrichum kahawae TaxID=34407 RepID=A0AAE0D1B9_COLKA|nr:hypothetical protein CKAH01_07223 [Colletotrichum kahawae]